MHTDKYKKEFADSMEGIKQKRIVELKNKKRNKWERQEFRVLLRKSKSKMKSYHSGYENCFFLGNKYFVLDTLIGSNNLEMIDLKFQKKLISKPLLPPSYQPDTLKNCQLISITPIFLTPEILEFKYFAGMGSEIIRFGEDIYLRFRINKDGSVTFLKLYSGIIYN